MTMLDDEYEYVNAKTFAKVPQSVYRMILRDLPGFVVATVGVLKAYETQTDDPPDQKAKVTAHYKAYVEELCRMGQALEDGKPFEWTHESDYKLMGEAMKAVGRKMEAKLRAQGVDVEAHAKKIQDSLEKNGCLGALQDPSLDVDPETGKAEHPNVVDISTKRTLH